LEESRETFLARKVSRAAFLWYLSFAEAKESTQNHYSSKGKYTQNKKIKLKNHFKKP
jgi:hypothetical protein